MLALDADPGYGLRRDDLIAKDGKPADVAARLAEYRAWQTARAAAQAAGRTPSLRVRTATAAAVDRAFDRPDPPEIRVVAVSRSTDRPFGPRKALLSGVVIRLLADSTRELADLNRDFRRRYEVQPPRISFLHPGQARI